jgi:two-component system phosphate regulon sensor histidine kinase PhoR
VLFFLITVLLPCGVIAVMATRMLVQDRELVATRVADERRAVVDDARRALLARVERLRLSAAAGPPQSRRDLPDDLVVDAALDGRDMVLPWDAAPVRTGTLAASPPHVHEAIARGERLEIEGRSFAKAAAVYLDVANTAPAPDQRAWARLLAARAYLKDARPADALAVARVALDTPPALVDDQGIPFVVYAARMLARSLAVTEDDAAHIVRALQPALASATLSPAAVYMMRDAVSALPGREEIAGPIDARARDIEQTLSLRSALPALGIPVATGDAEPTWVRFGPAENMWLVSIGTRGDARIVTAVRAAPLVGAIEATTPVTITTSTGGDSLAPTFPGLRAVVSPEALAAVARQSGRDRPFYLGAIVLVISVAVFGAVLFWRDVRRDIHLAELRSQFVSSVSHELKTPLTSIRMFAETLLMGRARPDAQHDYLETIVNESERLTRLLDNVLDFAGIESGKKTYRLEPQSLAPVVRAAARAMEYPFSQRGVDLRIAIDEAAPAVAADADALQQAILNLLSNAVKYSGEGRLVDLELTTAEGRVVIAVTDRGPGIAPGEQARYLDKYNSVRDSATARVPGTGLGLTLVEHVARGHGGRVTVRSAPGQGSTFALTIPFAGGSAQPGLSPGIGTAP